MKQRIVELDGMRALAILAVMACHFYPFSTMLFRVPEFGWVGVELFFVLSGFLITSILLQLRTRPNPYRVFYARRILRIFPPYFVVFALVIGVALWEHDAIAWRRVAQNALFLQSFSNAGNVLKQMAQVVMGARPVPNLFAPVSLTVALAGFPISGFSTSYSHTWSLSVEEWFYILWAPMVLMLRRRTLVYACVVLCAVALFVRWFGFLGVNSYFLFFARMDVFMGGALLALWVERRPSLAVREQRRGDAVIGAVGVGCWAMLAMMIFGLHPVLGREIRESLLFTVIGLPLLGFGFVGWMGYVIRHAGSERMSCRMLRWRPLVTLGVVSYMLYLVHVPIYFLVTQGAGRMAWDTREYGVALVVAVLSAGISIGLAMLSMRYFEGPIARFKDRVSEDSVG